MCARALLGAVVLAAGEGVVVFLGCVVRVGAGLILVVGLVVPGPVVEIGVAVGDLGAVEPINRDTGAGGAGVVTGVDGGGAADGPEAGAVGPDVGVAGRGAALGRRCCSQRCRWAYRCAWSRRGRLARN